MPLNRELRTSSPCSLAIHDAQVEQHNPAELSDLAIYAQAPTFSPTSEKPILISGFFTSS
jgi:hypothetical protein|tara:strand:+ start:462 stop:641 length:180 start_codon:yes stop_codon:yes gene_type:complete